MSYKSVGAEDSQAEATGTSITAHSTYTMVSKMIALALCVMAALGGVRSSAPKYPAGVDPHLCPDYPHCDNAALGAHASAVGALIHASRAPALGYGTYGHGPVVPVADGYPAGVHPYTCPNYPYCGPTPAHVPTRIWARSAAYGAAHYPLVSSYGAAYAFASPAKGADRYPAGVDPHSCPNYPYCH